MPGGRPGPRGRQAGQQALPGRGRQVRQLGQVGAVEGHQAQAPVQVPEEIGEVAEAHQAFGNVPEAGQVQVGQELQGAVAAPHRDDGLDLRIEPDLLEPPGQQPVRLPSPGPGMENFRAALHPEAPLLATPGLPASQAGRAT